MKDRGNTYKFLFEQSFFLDGRFEYGDVGNFKLLRWMQYLHQST
jgi:hypothetical protein